MQIWDKFSKVKVLVIGDVMVDRYCWGSVNRISPEAPVPVVSHESTTLAGGGAANVAANIAGLGATPILVGITGDDEEAGLLPGIMESAGISEFKFFPIEGRKTTVKTRIVAHNQQLVRLDQETSTELRSDESEAIFQEVKSFFDIADVIVISDYAKGLLTTEFVQSLISWARATNKSILVDPKGNDYSKYTGATILTPNEKEASEACRLGQEGGDLVQTANEILLDGLDLEALLITQGEAGMTLLQKGKPTSYLKATARHVYDVTGAGDTVVATLAVALGAGLDLLGAAEIANLAAGFVVENVGTTPIALSDLLTFEPSVAARI